MSKLAIALHAYLIAQVNFEHGQDVHLSSGDVMAICVSF